MTKELMQRWIEALRSGKYKQGKIQLRNEQGRYCCLGVLCEVAGVDISATDTMLPRSLQDSRIGLHQFGFDIPRSLIPKEYKYTDAFNYLSLSVLNDRGVPFDKIADLIEKHYESIRL